jgi:hypothetical protein
VRQTVGKRNEQAKRKKNKGMGIEKERNKFDKQRG